MIEELKEFNYPDWAKYVAVDNDGEVYAYENEPVKEEGVWDGLYGSLSHFVGHLYDFDDNVVIKIDDLLLGTLKDGGFGSYTITSPLNNVGKEVYIIVNNSITKERISKVVLSRGESEDGDLMPLEEIYYFAKLDVCRSADGVYFNKEDLIKGL